MKHLIITLCLFTLLHIVQAQTSQSLSYINATQPQGFLENCGQVQDMDNNPVDYVYFGAHVGDQQVYLTRDGLSILFSRVKNHLKSAPASANKLPHAPQSQIDSISQINYELERIDIVLTNSTIRKHNIIATPVEGSPVFNMYIGSEAINYKSIVLNDELLVKDVYPGIDWKVYFKKEPGKQPYIKYDFIVHAGADASQIQLTYSNNAKLSLSNNEVTARSIMGTIKEEKPYSYIQENSSEVQVNYKVDKNTIGFLVENYEQGQTLVIDPSIFWITFLRANSTAFPVGRMGGNDVETDSMGNIFVQLSARRNAPFPTVNPGGGAYYQDFTASTNGSMVVCKFAPGGQLLWSTYFGDWVTGRCMTVDKKGNIIAVGWIVLSSPEYPNPKPTIPLVNAGGHFDTTQKAYFIARFTNGGKLTWSSWFVNAQSYPMDMTYDEQGNVFVVGWSERNDFPTVDPGGGAYVVNNAQHGYAQTFFISQFDSTSRLTWSTRIEGSDYDPLVRVCTDKVGNIFLAGQVRSTNYPLVNAGGYFYNVEGSVITRFNKSRQMTWSTYFPGSFSFRDITVDDSSNIYIATTRQILKFDRNTNLVYQKSLNTTKGFYWSKIIYDPVLDQLQLLGIMNDWYYGFPTINTACNGSFYNNGISPHTINNATGPIFSTMDRNGNVTYLSLVDWPVQYYQYNEMAVDRWGNTIYLFGNIEYSGNLQQYQLTNPGNGAYFDNACCGSGSTQASSLLVKLLPSELSVTTTATQSVGCACNGAITTTVGCGQAPFKFIWSNGDTTSSVSGLCPGSYWVKVTDANNLSRTVYTTLQPPPGSITSFKTIVTPENCKKANGTISVQSVQGGAAPFMYSINGSAYQPTPLFTDLDSNIYTIRVKDSNGCFYSDTVKVPAIKGPFAVNVNNQNSTCKADDGKIEITGVQGGIGPYLFSLNGSAGISNNIFPNLAAGTYLLSVSDTAGCRFQDSIKILKAVAPTNITYTVLNDHCNQNIGSIEINSVSGGTAPYAYSANGSSFVTGIIDKLAAGSYTLYVKDSNGCILQKGPVALGNLDGPLGIDHNVTHALCGKSTGAINILGSNGGFTPFTYSIDGGSYTNNTLFAGLQPGVHQLSVKDKYGCPFTLSANVDFKPLANVTLIPADTTVCYDEIVPLQIVGETNRVRSIQWNVPAQGNLITWKATEEKKIIANIIDENFCPITAVGLVKVKACNPPEKCLEIPSAFTPNNDGKNDLFGIVLNGCRIRSMHLKVFNRWGELVFQSRQEGSKWNGTYKGLPQPRDVYAFVCEYITEDGISRQKKGTVLLIR